MKRGRGKKMKKWKKVLAMTLVVSMLSGCAMQEFVKVTKEESNTEEIKTEEAKTAVETE